MSRVKNRRRHRLVNRLNAQYEAFEQRMFAEIEAKELAQSKIPVCGAYNPDWGMIEYEDRMPEDLDYLPCLNCGHVKDAHINQMPSGPCWNCGTYKHNTYGLCPKCFRFGLSDKLSKEGA